MRYECQGKHFLEAMQMLTLNLQSLVGDPGRAGVRGVRAPRMESYLPRTYQVILTKNLPSLTLLELCAEGRQSGERGKGRLDHGGHEVFGLYSVGNRQPLNDVKYGTPA